MANQLTKCHFPTLLQNSSPEFHSRGHLDVLAVLCREPQYVLCTSLGCNHLEMHCNRCGRKVYRLGTMLNYVFQLNVELAT